MICPECGEECTPYQEDVGIGYTEAWGIPHNDVQLVWLCSECECELEGDFTPEPDWDSYDSMYYDPDFH